VYICYVDESGHCGEAFDPNQPVEVLCGVLCDLTKLARTQRDHQNLLDDLGILELKTNDAYRGRRDWARVSPDVRTALFDKLASWASERKCKFVVSPIDSDRFFKAKNNGCTLCGQLHYPWEAGALHVLLGLQRVQHKKSKNKGRTIVIFDEQTRHDARLLQVLEGDLSFTDGYTGYTIPPRKKAPPRLDQIVDVPHFSKSHLAVLIQIADWAAFILNRMLCLRLYQKSESYAGETKALEGWYRQIENMSVPSRAMARPGSDPLCVLFRDGIAPQGWSWKQWP
jgi:hypothetical protein